MLDPASGTASTDAGHADGASLVDGGKRWLALGQPDCHAPGCIRSARLVGEYTRDSILPYLEAGVSIDNGYSIGVIEYVTRDRTSLATVAIPFPQSPAPGGYHVVANAHGTAGLDDACKLSDTQYGLGLAGLFGARGAIGIAPDYPGLGTPGTLPYLVSEIEGAAVLDSLRAAHELASSLGLALSARYAVVGLSEGGHATLAAAAMHGSYAPELEIRAFGAAAPANLWFEQWARGLTDDDEHVPYHAMLFDAWAGYYHYDGPSLWTAATASRIDDVMTNSCAFDFGGTRSTYADALGTVADQIFAPDFLRAYRAGMLPDSAAVFTSAFASNRIGPYTQTAPLSIWQGDADVSISEPDTAQLVSALRAGGVVVDYHVISGGQHTTTAFGFVAQHQLATDESIAWVFSQLAR
jgi:acetyl esterase/lipase